MFLLLKKAYCIFPYSASIRMNLLLRVILVYPLSHGLVSLHRVGPVNDPGMSDWLGPPPLAGARIIHRPCFTEHHSFTFPRKQQGAIEMMMQYVLLYAHSFLTGRRFFKVSLQLSIIEGISYKCHNFSHLSKMHVFLPILC
jgi:hypothetical protein